MENGGRGVYDDTIAIFTSKYKRAEVYLHARESESTWKDVFFIFCCVGYTVLCAYRNL